MCFYNTLKNIKKKKHNFGYVGNRHDTYMYMVKIWCNARLGDCTFRSWSTNCSIIFHLLNVLYIMLSMKISINTEFHLKDNH